MRQRHLFIALNLWLFAFADGPAAIAAPHRAATGKSSWIGVYTSPSEIAGFSGTVLSIERSLHDDLTHRRIFHSDSGPGQDIVMSQDYGDVITDGDKVYVAIAYGHYDESGKAVIAASLQRYTRLKIRGRTVLLRDDALAAYRRENRIYDYGVLIKVSGGGAESGRLEDARHLSIKTIYVHPRRRWRDPFVHGANRS